MKVTGDTYHLNMQKSKDCLRNGGDPGLPAPNSPVVINGVGYSNRPDFLSALSDQQYYDLFKTSKPRRGCCISQLGKSHARGYAAHLSCLHERYEASHNMDRPRGETCLVGYRNIKQYTSSAMIQKVRLPWTI